MDTILPQHILETQNSAEILTNLSNDTVITNQKTSQSKKPVSPQVSDKGNPLIRRTAASEVVKYTGRIHLSKFQH